MSQFFAQLRLPPLYRVLGWSVNLFRIRGILLSLHFSFFLLLGYAGWLSWEGDPAAGVTGGMSGLAWHLSTFLVFFGCVVLHELGHCFMAMHFGTSVRRILLLPIGGMAEFDSMPREPHRELLVALAGPAVNFVIAAALWLVVGLPEKSGLFAETEIRTPVEFGRILLQLNLGMGIFNLIPVFPMDGGRVLRALLALKLSYRRATLIAATLAKILAAIAIVVAIDWEMPMAVVLFVFIAVVGEIEYRAVRRREREDAHWREVYERFIRTRPAEEEPPVLRQ